jgi:alkylated DNA repair protein (DNA oxidative demethylase)
MYEVSKDVYLFRGVLSLEEQKLLIDFYQANKEDFYRPQLASGSYMSLTMNCLGNHWDAKDYRYHKTRTDVDDKPVKPVPKEFINLAKTFSLAAFPYHNPDWDICIVNHYRSKIAKLGMHQDNSETTRAIESGHPIVSFSVGARCEFSIGPTRYGAKTISLAGGDVLVFGGSARLHYHGVKTVHHLEKHGTLSEGRLNFTLRKL